MEPNTRRRLYVDIKRILTHWPFRSKLLLFLLIIFLPALGIIVAPGFSQRQPALVKAQDDALLLVRSEVAESKGMRSNNHNNISIVNFITTGRMKSMPIVIVATQVMA